MRKLISCLFATFVFASVASAQWECPSQLAAFLKPAGNSNLYWGSELTGGAGYLDKNWIGNGMGLVGLNWSNGKSTIYAEGGLKYWNRYDIDASKDHSNTHLGIRELYYQYKASKSEFTLGVQSSRLDDDYLLNERVLGANLKLTQGKWTFDMLGGTVTKDFARNGTFCNVGYMYDILVGRQRSLIGNGFGDTNLASASLKYQPGKKSTKKTTSDDEFSSDEFSQGLDAPSSGKATAFKVESVGAIVYHEFGDWIAQKFVTTGIFAQTEWGNGWSFKPEVLFQSAKLNNAIIYSFRLEKMLGGENSKTNFSLRYLGKTNIDDNARILNSFSNIFAGDVIRLDAIDLPFIQAGFKYALPKQKIHFKTQIASQVNGNSMKELDFEVGKRFGKHLQVNALSGIVRSNLLNNDAILGRIEFRYNF